VDLSTTWAENDISADAVLMIYGTYYREKKHDGEAGLGFHTDAVTCLVVPPMLSKPRQLISGSRDGTVRVWQDKITHWECEKVLKVSSLPSGATRAVHAVIAFTDGRIVAGGEQQALGEDPEGGLHVWLGDSSLERRIHHHTGPITALSFDDWRQRNFGEGGGTASPVCSASLDGTIRIYRVYGEERGKDGVRVSLEWESTHVFQGGNLRHHRMGPVLDLCKRGKKCSFLDGGVNGIIVPSNNRESRARQFVHGSSKA
jgi:WD40 repeat protein